MGLISTLNKRRGITFYILDKNVERVGQYKAASCWHLQSISSSSLRLFSAEFYIKRASVEELFSLIASTRLFE